MAEKIIEGLEKLSKYLPNLPHACIADRILGVIREEIKGLGYNDFLNVLTYVRNSDLPREFKEELEVDCAVRGQSKH